MRRDTLVRCAIIAVLLAAASGAAAQQAPGHYAGQSLLRGSLGEFAPDGDSSYWREKEIDFTGSTDGFDDLTLALDYAYFVSPRVGLLMSFAGWEGQQTQSYRDFVDSSGGEIAHLTTIEQYWFEAGVLYHFLARRAPVMPYIGAGGGLVSWSLREEGRFIDFDQSPPPVFSDAFESRGDTFSYFLLAGVEIPLSSSVALFAEGRWRGADDEMGGDFAGFGTLDLSGTSVSGGLSIAF
jgi:opacity protein-like surface antigen